MPLDTKRVVKDECYGSLDQVPTADVRGVLEGLGHVRVHVDQQIFLSGDLSIAVFDLALDPLAEVVANDRAADVHDPLFWQLGQLLVDGEELKDLLVLLEEVEDVLH